MNEPKIVKWADPTFEVTLENGECYTYNFLPAIYMEDGQIQWASEILKEAVNYKSLVSAFISERQFLHLYHKLNFAPSEDDPTEMSFFYHLIEGKLNIFKHSDGYYKLWVYPNGIPGSAEDRLINDVLKSTPHYREGLNVALDPNCGGIFSLETLEVASLIIFG